MERRNDVGALLPFAGAYEMHLTIAASDAGTGAADDALRSWAAQRRLKFTHIVLDSGDFASQPMLTRHASGTGADAIAEAHALGAEMRRFGFRVTRIKIEVATDNPAAPRSDDDARGSPPGQYFEHHVKLLLAPGARRESLEAALRPFAAHLSRNAAKRRVDGYEERFVTQRCRNVGLETAQRSMSALAEALFADGYSVLEQEQEFVVFDSNLGLDSGWLPDFDSAV